MSNCGAFELECPLPPGPLGTSEMEFQNNRELCTEFKFHLTDVGYSRHCNAIHEASIDKGHQFYEIELERSFCNVLLAGEMQRPVPACAARKLTGRYQIAGGSE